MAFYTKTVKIYFELLKFLRTAETETAIKNLKIESERVLKKIKTIGWPIIYVSYLLSTIFVPTFSKCDANSVILKIPMHMTLRSVVYQHKIELNRLLDFSNNKGLFFSIQSPTRFSV